MNTLDRYNDLVFAYQYDYSEGDKSCHGDIEYYIQKLSSINNKILELGCGTGRITIPLKKAGMDIQGLDHAKAMLEIANQKTDKVGVKIKFIQADAVDFKIEDRFAAIFMPYNSICFIENNRLPAFIENIKKHLLDNGRFLFDISKMPKAIYDENNKKFIDWSEPLFIKELNLSVRRKMEMTYEEEKNIVDSIYFWEITDSLGKKINQQTRMTFSTFDVEDYVNFFEKNNFKVKDISNVSFSRGNMERIHSFVELVV